MTAETEFKAAVDGDATLTSLIGDRCWPNKARGNATLPYIVYASISDNPYASGASAPADRMRIQAGINAASYSEVKAIRDALRALCTAQQWRYIGGPDSWEDDSQRHRQTVDVMIVT